MTIDMEQFKSTYIEESTEGLDIMESNLLNLEVGSTDNDVINDIFRAAHSIKGGGATFGFSDISDFTHVVETLLDEIRNGDREITKEAIDLFLKSIDVIRAMLDAEKCGTDYDQEQAADVKQKLDELLDVSPLSAAQTSEVSPSPKGQAKPATWTIYFKPYPNLLRSGNDVVRMFRELARLGKIRVEPNIDSLAPLKDLDAEECQISWHVTLDSECDQAQIDDVFVWVAGDCDLTIEPLGVVSKPDTKPSSAPEEAETMVATGNVETLDDQRKSDRRVVAERRQGDRRTGVSQENSSIRVNIEKVDELINMVGELVITQSMLSQLGEDFDMDRVDRLQDGLTQLERNTRELQESVMRIRMLPISFAFNRFPRMIHDMCGKFGKKVELKLSGESTELDKTVMEKIGDPLVHLVRNCMDHGIEMPQDRVAKGKPETGTVFLNAYHQGGNIVIEITDDGAGIDRDKILSLAIKRGLAEEDESLPDTRIYDFLFEPGFSTAEKVTEVSGRGVGMDVVKRNISALGGTVEVATKLDEGTTFTIRLPLTLAIVDGQTVSVGDETYIVSLISIVESMQIKQGLINYVAGKGEIFKLRDEFLPVIRLHEIFGVKSRSTNLTDGLLMVVEGEGRKIGLFVDDLLGQQQVVIKSLEANYKKVTGVSGATILGDGSVALILDIPSLIRMANEDNGMNTYSMSA